MLTRLVGDLLNKKKKKKIGWRDILGLIQEFCGNIFV